MDSKKNKKYNPCIVPTSLVKSCARALQSGIDKGYCPQSYLDGDIDTYKNALYRHLIEYLEGHMVDKESGLSVLDHMVANISILIELENQRPKESNLCGVDVIERFLIEIVKPFEYENEHWVGAKFKCRSIYFGGYEILIKNRWIAIDKDKVKRIKESD